MGVLILIVITFVAMGGLAPVILACLLENPLQMQKDGFKGILPQNSTLKYTGLHRLDPTIG